jgi:hypothetical protein
MTEEQYIQMAQDHPNMLCSEVPVEILEASSYAGGEPTGFLNEFFAAGYKEWLLNKYGQPIRHPREIINTTVILLWLRACHLYTSKLLDRPDLDWDKPFFSDEELYD